MTRTNLLGLLVGVPFVLGSLAAGPLFAQSGYAPKGAAKGTPAAGTKTQPTGGATTGSKGPVYGPSAPRTEQPRTASGGAPSGAQPSVRRVAGDEPVREPVSGANPGGAAPTKTGIPKKAPGGVDNPIPVIAQNTRQPEWYPLAPNVQTWVDEVLVAWEKTSEEIVTFKCNFKRWEYDPAFGPKDPEVAYTYGKGIIQYAKPDKGMFKVESLVKYSAPLKAGEQPQYLEQIGEQWVCDGRSIFEFDTRGKKLFQRILPKEMQNKAIADGPLPFLFGAKVTTIKARYWIRPAENVPAGHENEYWLEAVPRYSRDAANFQKVTIVLDEKDFLPKALDVYAPNYNRKTNPAHAAYAFDKRETTLKSDKRPFAIFQSFVDNFKKQFYAPDVPSGWKKVVEDMNEVPQGPLPVQGPAPAGTATRPAVAPKTKTK